MRPWISAASFQDDFAGLPELLHLSHAPGLSQPGNSQIADLVFGREKCAEAGQKTKLSFPAPVKPLFPNCLVTDRCFRISFEPSRLKYRRICIKPAVSASSQPSETVHMILIFDLFAEAKVTRSAGKPRSPAVSY
jgi:hypothetical protein